MIDYFLPILKECLPLWTNFVMPIFCLAFIITVPCIIREFVRFR